MQRDGGTVSWTGGTLACIDGDDHDCPRETRRFSAHPARLLSRSFGDPLLVPETASSTTPGYDTCDTASKQVCVSQSNEVDADDGSGAFGYQPVTAFCAPLASDCNCGPHALPGELPVLPVRADRVPDALPDHLPGRGRVDVRAVQPRRLQPHAATVRRSARRMRAERRTERRRSHGCLRRRTSVRRAQVELSSSPRG